MGLDIIRKAKKTKKTDNMSILNVENLRNAIGQSEDIKFREILINNNIALPVNLIYIDGLVNSSDVSNYVIKPLMQEDKIQKAKKSDEIIELIKNGILYFSGQSFTNNLDKVIDELMSGSSVLLFSDHNIAFIFDTKGFEKRAIMEPTVENVTKGSKDSFVENYRTNIATIRKKVRTKDLIAENISIGEQTHTRIGIVYIKSIINDEVLSQVKERLNSINTDNVLTTSIIEDALSDDINSFFPQVVSTERPDKFCADIIEGRAGVIVDGIPFGFIVPGTFVQFMQTPEDYSRKHIVSSLIRIIRLVAIIISLMLPALYISITTFQPEMIPTNLALFIAKSREGVTFPATIETLGMLLSFEILYEAGLRVPKTVGQAVSIVGTLVVGQAAVEAKLVSPSVVVIVAMTAITAFTIPNQDISNAVRIWRIIFAVLGSVLGLIGIVIAIILFTFQLCKLNSFGVPYMAPFVSSDDNNMLSDTILRIPIKQNKMRPGILETKNMKRQGN